MRSGWAGEAGVGCRNGERVTQSLTSVAERSFTLSPPFFAYFFSPSFAFGILLSHKTIVLIVLNLRQNEILALFSSNISVCFGLSFLLASS